MWSCMFDKFPLLVLVDDALRDLHLEKGLYLKISVKVLCDIESDRHRGGKGEG